eukprot:11469915-Alexandrium_andersonii.AAC.1
MALDLPPRALYDAEGNSFDVMAVAVRLAGMVEGLAAGSPPPWHTLPDVHGLLRLYACARTWVRRANCDAPRQPFPSDLRRLVFEYLSEHQVREALATQDVSHLPPPPPGRRGPPRAAENGRRGQ